MVGAGPDVPRPSWAIRSSDLFRECVGESGKGTADIRYLEEEEPGRGEVLTTPAGLAAAAGGESGVALSMASPIPAMPPPSLRSDDVEGREGVA